MNTPNDATAKGQNVMLYDTQAGHISSNVYDIKSVPTKGQTTTIGNTSATYIGSGH